jgi:ketopantoate reductase
MKILIFGAGVVGITYAWQMHEAGLDVTLFVRRQRLVRYSHSGVPITCTDMRKGTEDIGHSVFRPKTTDRLEPGKPYDLIIVCVRSTQLNDTIPFIARYSGNAHILFMGNMWDELRQIKKHLPKGRFFLGYPGVVGGNNIDNGINCYLFRKKNTIIGEPDDKTSVRLQKTTELFEEAGLQPHITSHITDILQHEYLRAGILPGLISKAGNAGLFSNNKLLIKQYIIALQEGVKICKKKGAQIPNIFPFNRLWLPTFALTYLLQRSMNTENLAALDAQQKHAVDEKKKMYLDVLKTARKEKIPVPYWASFEKYMDFT